MQHLKRALILTCLLSTAVFSSQSFALPVSPKGLKNQAELLKNDAIARVGVSIHALFLLVSTDEQAFLPYTLHESKGNLKYFKELEDAGLARMKIHRNSPTSKLPAQMFQLIPTPAGKAVKKGLQR